MTDLVRYQDPEEGMPPPPTPEQIAERCAEIRRGWDAATRAARAAYASQIPWEVLRLPPGLSARLEGSEGLLDDDA